MYSVANKVGRLIEMAIAAPVTIDEASRAFIEARACVSAVTARGERAIIVADLHDADVFAPDVADKFTLLMRAQNPYMDRSATLVSEGATSGLQFLRMIREAGNPARRVFKRRYELEVWLAEVLSPAEREHLHLFLDERGVYRARQG